MALIALKTISICIEEKPPLPHNSLLVTLLLQKLLTALWSSLLTARPTLWDIDFANQLSSVTNQMPRNGLEEMIQWTKDGKMWQYPINNEDGEYSNIVLNFVRGSVLTVAFFNMILY